MSDSHDFHHEWDFFLGGGGGAWDSGLEWKIILTHPVFIILFQSVY